MTYPAAGYRSERARDQGGRGIQPAPQPSGPRLVGPWDRPASPQQRVPHGGIWSRTPVAANDNVRRLALRGIRIAARAHPLMRFIELIDIVRKLLRVFQLGYAQIEGRWTVVCAVGGGFPHLSNANPCPNPNNPLPPAGYNLPDCPGFGGRFGLWEFQFVNGIGLTRYKMNARYLWNGGSGCGAIYPRPNTFPENEPPPGHAPEEFIPPRPMPWRAIPHQEPHPDVPRPYRRETGPLPQERPAPYVQPRRDPFRYPEPEPGVVIGTPPRRRPVWWPNGQPSSRPGPAPATASPPTGRGPGSPAPQPPAAPPRPGAPSVGIGVSPPHMFRPPRKGEKETKKKAPKGLAGAGYKVGKYFGKLTEASDALECVYGALPEKLRKREAAKRHGKQPSAINKLKIIAANSGSVDFGSMMSCSIQQHVSDFVIGKANQRLAKARKAHGIRGGYMSRVPGSLLK